MDDLLQQGITAYKAGRREEARKIFISVVKQNPETDRAWGWMYNVSNSNKERIDCLKQMLRINPKNEKASILLKQLINEPPIQTPSNVTPVKNNQSPEILLKRCPYCAKEIPYDAIVCKHCGKDISKQNATPLKKNKRNVVVLAISVVIICSCLYLFFRPGRDSGDSVMACWDVTVTSCDLDNYGGYVYGTVKNNCGTKLHSAEIMSEVYSGNGVLLASDPEYVENLDPGEQGTFQAIMDKPASQGSTCKSYITRGY